MEEWKFEGMINPTKREASFTAKMDRIGRISVPRLIRDKLGISSEAVVAVHIKLIEAYKEEREEKEEKEKKK